MSGQTNGVVDIRNGKGGLADGGDGSYTLISDPDPVGDVCSAPSRMLVSMAGNNINWRAGCAPMWAAWEAGDRRGAVDAVPERVLDELFVIGTPQVCAAHVHRYVHSGVDVPVLSFLPLDPGRDEVTDALAVAAAFTRGSGG